MDEGQQSSGDRWLDCEPELDGRLLRPMLHFYGQQFGRPALERLASELGTSLAALEDPDRWFSVELFRELHQAMTDATGDPDIVYKAGRAVTRPGVMGAERAVIRALLSVRGVLRNWPGLAARFRRQTHWSVTFRKRGHAVATFSTEEGAADDIQLCRHRRGILESLPELFELPPADVLHVECIHKGDPHCRYEVHWLERPNILRISLLMTLLSAVGWAALHLQGSSWAGVLAGSALAMVFVSFIATLTTPRGTVGVSEPLSEDHVGELRDLLDRNRRRVQELQAIGAVAAATRSRLDEGGLVSSVLEALRLHLSYRRVMLLLVLPERAVLGQVRARGFGSTHQSLDELEVSLRTLGNRPPRLFAQILQAGQPILIRDVDALGEAIDKKDQDLLETLSASCFVAAPVVGGNEPLGLLFVDRSDSEDDLTLRDAELLGNVASTLGAALSNARLFRRVQEELMINRKFTQYLPPGVVDKVRLDPKAALQLGGQEVDLAVMLIDIAAFTPTSAALSPEEVVAGLNTWFGITDRVIARCNGIVDKRMGDGVLVVFMPEETDRNGRHPVERAAAAAVAIQGALDASRDIFEEEAPGFAQMQVRYAIHYGTVTIGNFGSDHRMEYTVIGDAVNACARLEEITPPGCIWLTGEAVTAPPTKGLMGATFEEKVTLRDYERTTDIWSIPGDAPSSRTGTWRLDEEPPSDDDS